MPSHFSHAILSGHFAPLLFNLGMTWPRRSQAQSDPVRPLNFLKIACHCGDNSRFLHFPFSIFYLKIWAFKVIQGYSRLNFFHSHPISRKIRQKELESPANIAGGRKTRFRLFPMIPCQRGLCLCRQACLLSHSFIESPGNRPDPVAPNYGTYRWLSHSNRVTPANPVGSISLPAKW